MLLHFLHFKLVSEFRQLLLDEETKIVGKATIVLCTNAVAQGRVNIKIDIEEQKFNLVNNCTGGRLVIRGLFVCEFAYSH